MPIIFLGPCNGSLSSSCSNGTTVFTNPYFKSFLSALAVEPKFSCVFSVLQSKQIRRTESWHQNLPLLGPVCPKMALSEAMDKSHTTWSMSSADGISVHHSETGLGSERIHFWTSRTFKRGTPSVPTYPLWPFTCMSPPLQKALVLGTGKNHYIDIPIFTVDVESITSFPFAYRRRSKGISGNVRG